MKKKDGKCETESKWILQIQSHPQAHLILFPTNTVFFPLKEKSLFVSLSLSNCLPYFFVARSNLLRMNRALFLLRFGFYQVSAKSISIKFETYFYQVLKVLLSSFSQKYFYQVLKVFLPSFESISTKFPKYFYQVSAQSISSENLPPSFLSGPILWKTGPIICQSWTRMETMMNCSKN